MFTYFFMDILPDDIINYIISDFINTYKSLYLMIQVNRYFFVNTILKYKNHIGHMRYLIQDIPQYILGLFDHESILAELPILDLNTLNYTIACHELGNKLDIKDLYYPIMMGRDIQGRKFLCLKIIFKSPLENEIMREIIITLYQNFLSYYNKSSWSFGYHPSNKCLFDLLNGRLNSCKKLINGETLKMKNYEIYLSNSQGRLHSL